MKSISRAGRWFLASGIQEPSGGVARYYRADLGRNLPLSTEITGYTACALVYLHHIADDDSRYLERARAAAEYLERAWDPALESMPFEVELSQFSYFFDCGIVVRGLMAAGGSGEIATAIGRSMARDFDAGADFHPILALPKKTPIGRDPMRWSQSSGCYQLKAALAWLELGCSSMRPAYDRMLKESLRSYSRFLPGHPESERVMDRLHPFLYFLEGLIPVAAKPGCAAVFCDGIRCAARLLREIGPQFERSDVYAQLLRIRVYADALGVTPLDEEEAAWEAGRLREFQASSPDPRIDGGFYFGRRGGEFIPHINPVSTAFAIQALSMWKTRQADFSVI